MRIKIAIGLVFISLVSFATQISVGLGQPERELESAIDQAAEGDTILVEQGTYPINELVITKPIHLKAKGKVILDGQFKGTILSFQTSHFSIDGFTIINVGKSYVKDHAAIYVSHADSFVIMNNILEEVFFGMLIEKSHFGKIRGNKVSSSSTQEANSGNGVHLWHCSDMAIDYNILTGLRDGIYFEFVSNSTIEHNESFNNLRYGLHFMFSNHNSYSHNLFKHNGAGVAVMFSKFIDMEYNNFEDNWGTASYGLLLKEIYDGTIHHNIFKDNTVGINAEGSNRIAYHHNVFNGNGWAVKIVGACYATKFTQNNFLNNSFDLAYNTKMNDNEFDQNFWSEYSGYDLNKDGIGDVPYRPVKLFSYIVNRTPEAIVLLRSLFVFIINFSEKVSPIFTPDNLVDKHPRMHPIS